MADTGVVRGSETRPRQEITPYGQLGSRLFQFARATPPVFTVITPGSSNQDFQYAGVVQEKVQIPPSRFVIPRVPLVALGVIQASGLVHSRALGALRVNPQVRITGLDHARALGTLVVSAPGVPPDPPDPPDPPETPHVTLTGGPRSIKGVRRRNAIDKD